MAAFKGCRSGGWHSRLYKGSKHPAELVKAQEVAFHRVRTSLVGTRISGAK